MLSVRVKFVFEIEVLFPRLTVPEPKVKVEVSEPTRSPLKVTLAGVSAPEIWPVIVNVELSPIRCISSLITEVPSTFMFPAV